MDRVAYTEIERQVADLVGYDGENLSADERRMVLKGINTALRLVWAQAWWPELMETRQTPFAPEWRSGTTYSAGTVLWDGVTGGYVFAVVSTTNKPYTGSGDSLEVDPDWAPLPVDVSAAALWDETEEYVAGEVVEWDGYWYCTGEHGTGVTSEPGTDTDWVAVPELLPEVPLAAYGRPKIGRVRQAAPLHPEREPNTDRFVVSTGRDGIRVDETEVLGLNHLGLTTGCLVPWLEYRVALAPLRGDPWSSSATYTAANLEDAVWGLD